MSSSFQFEPISLVWKQDVLQVLMSSLVIKDKISARLNNLSLLNKNSNLHSHPEYVKFPFFLVCSNVSHTGIIPSFTDVTQTKQQQWSTRILEKQHITRR